MLGYRYIMDRDSVFYFALKKLGILGMVIAASYLTYSHHGTLKRLEDNLLRRNVAIESGFFPDPAGLGIDIRVNERGMKEVYLVHRESGASRKIMHDLESGLETLMNSLEHRAYSMDVPEACYTLARIKKIEEIIDSDL